MGEGHRSASVINDLDYNCISTGRPTDSLHKTDWRIAGGKQCFSATKCDRSSCSYNHIGIETII